PTRHCRSRYGEAAKQRTQRALSTRLRQELSDVDSSPNEVLYMADSSSRAESLDNRRDSSPTVAGSNSRQDQGSAYMRPEVSTTVNPDNPIPVKSPSIAKDSQHHEHPKTVPAETEEIRVTDFHLFYWLAAVPGSSKDKGCSGSGGKPSAHRKKKQTLGEGLSFTIDHQKLQDRISQMHNYIADSTRIGSRAYAQCPASSLSCVQDRMAKMQAQINSEDDGEDMARSGRGKAGDDFIIFARDDTGQYKSRQRSSSDSSRHPRSRRRSPPEPTRSEYEYSRRREEEATLHGARHRDNSKIIVRLVKQIFDFFFPLDHTSKMVKEYWGAVFWLLDNSETMENFCDNYKSELLEVRALTQSLAHVLIHGPAPDLIHLPIEFSRAWIHLITFWVLVVKNRSSSTRHAELDKCRRSLESGRNDLFRMRATQPLYEYEAVLPSGILSLLINKLAGDVMTGVPDVQSTYHAYLSNLEQEVQQKPYNRGHQEKITSVRQEISCVNAVLQQQNACISTLLSTLLKRRINAPPDFSQRKEFYILQDCLASIGDRIGNFRALDERARGIAAFNLHRIESNRDRQEGAILVFTLVTIIFLPLSFVSSFFGMNTSDIRSMATPQWAFWASAIPLTAIVVGVSIFLARKIEPVKDFWNSIAERWRVQPEAQGFYPAPPMVSNQPDYGRQRVVVPGLPYSRPVQGQEHYSGAPGGARRRHVQHGDY
ncbi:MAG: hypothetical protein Q9218_007844, partial [Villophora microphyllina]